MNYKEIKPKLKKAYPVVYDKNRILVGGFGKNIEYADPTGSVYFVFKLLTGKYTIKQITRKTINQYSQYTEKDVFDLINDLNSERIIEDANISGTNVLSKYELERYHRNINFFSSFIDLKKNKYRIQRKISDTTVGIIGLGGLGSHIVYDLAALGIGHIKAIEFDKLDLTNLNRQILYNYEDVGKSKGHLAKKRIHDFNPKVKFDLFEKKVTSAKDITDCFNDVDFIILVADRPKYYMAHWANESAVTLNVPMFVAGLEAQRAMYYTIIPHKTGCVECWRQSVRENDHISDEVLQEKERMNLLGDNTAIVPLVSAVTGLIMSEILRYISGIGSLQAAGNLIAIDFLTMNTKIIETWKRNPNCAVCGGH